MSSHLQESIHEQPVVEELPPTVDSVSVFRKLSRRRHCLFLDSALRQDSLGRYSFVAADPFDFVQLPAGGRDGFAELAERLKAMTISPVAGLPPFQGFIELAHRIDDPDVRFLIVGACRDPEDFPGSYTEDELRLAIGNDSRVMYLGYRLDMENIYATSDIVVMPSRWDEPFGLINIEAGAASVPVVATAVGGIPEIIEHGVTGFLVARDDVDELAHYTKLLVDDPQRRGQMGKAARSLVEARFNHEPIRELEQLYIDVCA